MLKDHNAVTPVRLELAASWSRVKHSSTEPLRSLDKFCDSFLLFVLFVFVALRPMSTAMVIAGRSVHLTTLFPGQA